MTELPGPPVRTVFDPSDSEAPPVKRGLPLRAVLIPVLLLGLAAGAFYIAKVTAGPTPDERATAIARANAQDALIAIFDTDENKQSEAGNRIRMDISRQLEGTGCTWVAGSMEFGESRAAAAKAADEAIATVRDRLGEEASEYGIGYIVVKGADDYVAVLAAIRCAPPTPAAPGGGA